MFQKIRITFFMAHAAVIAALKKFLSTLNLIKRAFKVFLLLSFKGFTFAVQTKLLAPQSGRKIR